MLKKLIRKLDLDIFFHENTVVYGSKRDIVIFALRLPLLMIFSILAFPFFILWGLCLGLKSFWYEFKEQIIDDGIILLPVMGFITAYRLIVYKKIRRSSGDKGNTMQKSKSVNQNNMQKRRSVNQGE